MPTTGVDKNPYPNSTDVPDGPGAFLLMAQRLTKLKGAGVGYAADSTALAALITDGDAFAGLHIYYLAADCMVRFNGSAFKLFGVKMFATTAAQTSWTSTYSGLLENGSQSFRIDAGVQDFWNTSAWRGAGAGVAPVVPSSVAGTGVTVSATGAVQFVASGTVASPISVNGCFTTTFDNYEIVLTTTSKSAAQNIQMRLRVGGADNSTASSYNFQRDTKNATSITTATTTGMAWELEAGGQIVSSIRTFVFAPALARATTLDVPNSVGGPTIYTATIGGNHTATSSFDGFSVYLLSGNMTGTLRIYGYNNN